MLRLCDLTVAIERTLREGRGVPLLVLRQPELERVAWREGKRRARRVERRTAYAFRRAASRVVRDGDELAHDAGSDRFVVAMLAAARLGRTPGAGDARAALERIGAAMSVTTGAALETGWWPLERAEEALALSHTIDAALERGMREREHRELLATVGHELRTPLTSIRGYIETLLDEGELDLRTSRRFLETARREALRLGRLVDGMMEFSLLDLSHPYDARCDVAEHAKAAAEAALPLAAQRGMHLDAVLPDRAAARVDGDACARAVLNLLENAVKYGRENGRIELRVRAPGDVVTVSVDDDGPGIAPEARDRIFAMGARASNERRGNGIGLAIVKAVAERAGGDARATASHLGGARFVVRFPSA